MLIGRNKLSLQDLEGLSFSLQCLLNENKSLQDLIGHQNGEESGAPTFVQIIGAEIKKKKNLIDGFADLVNSFVQDASILIETEQATSEQNGQLLASLQNLQSDYLNLRDENDLLRNELLTSALNIQKLEEEKQELLESSRKMRSQFDQLTQHFEDEKSKLKCQISAFTNSELYTPRITSFEVNQERAVILKLQEEVKKLKQEYEEEKYKNFLITKELQLAEIGLKEFEAKISNNKKIIKIATPIEMSLDKSQNKSQKLQRQNLKELGVMNLSVDHFNSSRLPQHYYDHQTSAIALKIRHESLSEPSDLLSEKDLSAKDVQTEKPQEISEKKESERDVSEVIQNKGQKQGENQNEQVLQVLNECVEDVKRKVEEIFIDEGDEKSEKRQENQEIQILTEKEESQSESEEKIIAEEEKSQQKSESKQLDQTRKQCSFINQLKSIPSECSEPNLPRMKVQQKENPQKDESNTVNQQIIIPSTHYTDPPISFQEQTNVRPATETCLPEIQPLFIEEPPISCTQIPFQKSKSNKEESNVEKIGHLRSASKVRLWLKSLDKYPKMTRQQTTTETQQYQKKMYEKFVISPKGCGSRPKFENVVLEKKKDYDQGGNKEIKQSDVVEVEVQAQAENGSQCSSCQKIKHQ